jgi:tRNA (guanosine-2'-O-)-methyltransferase
MDLQAMYALYSSHLSTHKKERFNAIAQNRTRHVTLVLEDLYQPQNASAVLRSAESFGIQDVHIIENNHAYHHYQSVSKGASKWLTVHRYAEQVNNTSSCFEYLKKKGYDIAVTHLSEEAIPLSSLPLEKPLAIVMGTELTGASDFAIANCDHQVQIPMFGFTESLNVATASGIICQEMKSRLNESDIRWQLSEEEQLALKIQWARHTVYWWEQLEETHLLK